MNVMKTNYVNEITNLMKQNLSNEDLLKELDNYHENDIAEALEFLTPQERYTLYQLLDVERVSEIFAYLEDASQYFEEMEIKDAAEIMENMDSDDAVDILENIDDEMSGQIVSLMDEDSSQDILLIQSFDDDEIGSKMTTNFIAIEQGLNVKQAMKELISQAHECDNIDTIYVCHKNGSFYGAIDLKDLIIAREYTDLESLISKAYPYVYAKEFVSECIEKIKDYAEDSIPVLDEQNRLLGVITPHDIIEVVDDELTDDYAKLGGLTSEEDLNESLFESMKKRLPWLVVLLGLGILVSSVVGLFEGVVSQVAIIVCFQSLILDMAGNVGTQSLAVTIRVLMDENLKTSQKIGLMWKEMRIGLSNGALLGMISFVLIGVYIWLFKNYEMSYSFMISGCVGISLVVAMMVSSFVGTAVPMLFHKLKIDPAVASGPLITTINDLVAILCYYGLAWLLLIQIM